MLGRILSRWVRLLLTFPLLLLVLVALQQLKPLAEKRQQMGPYLWQDEAASTEPALSIHERGYLGFRCMAAPWITCYGGSGPMVDALALTLAPADWLKAGEIRVPGGVRWPWTQRYPNVGKLLLDVRLGFVLALLLLLAVAPRGDWRLSLLFPSLLAGSFFFGESWQGIKNDFPAAFFLLLFFACHARASFIEPWERRRWALRVTLLIGVFAACFRLSAAPAVAITVACWLGAEIARGPATARVYLQIAREALLWTVLAVLAYLALHPNTWAAGGEARWWRAYLDMTRVGPAGNPWKEAALALQATWPFALAVVIGAFALEGDFKRWTWRFLAPVGLSLAVLERLNIRAALGRSNYHLPAFTLSCLALALTFARLRPSVRLRNRWLALVLLPALTLSQTQPGGRDALWTRLRSAVTSAASLPKGAQPPEPWIEALLRPGSTWFVDRNLRLAIPTAAAARARIVDFDSLSWSPSRVAGEAARLGAPGAQVLSACWSGDPQALALDPIVGEWARAGKGRCGQVEKFGKESLIPFLVARHPRHHFVAPAAALAASGASYPSFGPGTAIHPRVLVGSEAGAERWEGPYFFDRSFELTQDFRELGARAGRVELEIRVSSSCKADGTIRATLSSGATTLASASRETGIRAEFCAAYARLCSLPDPPRGWLTAWSRRPFAIEPLRLTATVATARKGAPPLALRIGAKIPEGEECSLILSPIEVR